MNYFKDNNNKVYAYDDEQVAQGYGKDLISLPLGEFYDGVSTTARPYKLDDTWVEIVKDEEGTIVAPQGLVEQLANEEAERLASEVKQAKSEALATIVVTTSNGNSFDGHSDARLNMSNAIQASEVLGLTTSNWKLADNTIKEISIEELKEALALSIKAVGDVIVGG